MSPTLRDFDGRQSPGRSLAVVGSLLRGHAFLPGRLTCLIGVGLNDLLSLRMIGGETKDQPRSNEHP